MRRDLLGVGAVAGVAAMVFALGFATGRLTVSDPMAGGALPDPDAAALVVGSAARPIPLHTQAPVGEWALQVAAFQPDATELVLAANQFNVDPPLGYVYTVVEVVLERRAPDSGVLRGSVDPTLVTPAGQEFRLGADCGVVSNPVELGRLVAPGQALRGRWCWALPSSQTSKVRLRVAGTGGGEVWFDLR